MASTKKGMMTWKEAPRLEAPKPRAAAKQSMPLDDVAGLLGLMGAALQLIRGKSAMLAAATTVSANVIVGLKHELEGMQQELEDMRCMDLKDPKAFKKCQAKYVEISKRLDKIRGLP